LLDVGAKKYGYSADISRTWIYGKPSDRQRAIYDAVLQLQDKAFSMLKPGVLLREYQQEMEKAASKLMKKLHSDTENEKYPHGFSHFLGIDVHDAGDYESPLVEGMVLTVEPGLYLYDERIGVRIEDNVIVTKNGIKNLSEHIPRDL
jgi:Xaa-Pro aminopeptidase